MNEIDPLTKIYEGILEATRSNLEVRVVLDTVKADFVDKIETMKDLHNVTGELLKSAENIAVDNSRYAFINLLGFLSGLANIGMLLYLITR